MAVIEVIIWFGAFFVLTTVMAMFDEKKDFVLEKHRGIFLKLFMATTLISLLFENLAVTGISAAIYGFIFGYKIRGQSNNGTVTSTG